MVELFVTGHPFLLAALVDAVVLFLLLGSLEMVLPAMLPVTVGLLWTVTVIGIHTSIIHVVLVTVVVAIVTACSLFLVLAELARFRGRTGRRKARGLHVALYAMVTMLVFGALVIARRSAMRAPGPEALLGMECSLAAAMTLVPAAARIFLRRSDCGGAPRLYHLAGGAWCFIYLVLIHVALLAIALPMAALIHPRSRSLRARWLRRVARPGLAGLAHTFPYGSVICTGITRAAFAKPAVIISNHQSIVDIPILARIPCDLRLTIKGQWWRHPLIGAGVKALGHVRVAQGDPDAVIRECSEAFAEGSSVHFFPQGTRARYDAPVRFHKGAFELAIHLNAEVQPVVLCDTWTCLPRGATWVEHACMRLRALPRITPATFDYTLGSRALARHAEELTARAWIEELELNNTPAILRRKVDRLYRYQGLRTSIGVFLRLRRDPTLAGLHGLVPRSGLILDLGCGYGAISHWLAQSGPERSLLGVDRNADKIRVAQCSAQGSRQVVFENQDLDHWQPPECAAALLIDIPGEFLTPAEAALLRRVFGALELGGQLFLRVAPSVRGARAAAATQKYVDALLYLGFSSVDATGGAAGGRSLLVARK